MDAPSSPLRALIGSICKHFTRKEYLSQKKSLRNRKVSPIKPAPAAARKTIEKKKPAQQKPRSVKAQLKQLVVEAESDASGCDSSCSQNAIVTIAPTSSSASVSASTSKTAAGKRKMVAAAAVPPSSCAAASSADARRVLSQQRPAANILPGSRILLVHIDCEMTVLKHDAAFAGRYYLRDPKGREFCEILHGKGKVAWELVCEASAQPTGGSADSPTDVAAVFGSPLGVDLDAKFEAEAKKVEEQSKKYPVSFATRTAQRLGRQGGQIIPATKYPTCPVCLEELETDRGIMPCCNTPVHKTCVQKWRNSNIRDDKRGANRGLKDEWKFDTRTCAAGCGFVHLGGTSIRRMFGD